MSLFNVLVALVYFVYLNLSYRMRNLSANKRRLNLVAPSSILSPLSCTGVGVTRKGPEEDAGAHDGHQDGEYEGGKSQGRHRLQSAYSFGNLHFSNIAFAFYLF